MKLTIGKKILLGFILISAISGIIGILGYAGMQAIKNRQKEFVEIRLNQLIAVSEIIEAHTTISSSERALMIPQVFEDTSMRNKNYSKKIP